MKIDRSDVCGRSIISLVRKELEGYLHLACLTMLVERVESNEDLVVEVVRKGISECGVTESFTKASQMGRLRQQ